MYLGPNKVAQARREYRTTVGDLGSWLSKVRKAIHKLAPRELSPTLMLKHQAAQKAKVKALETQVSETQRQAANAVENVKTDAAVQILQAKAAPTPSSVAAPGFSTPSPVQPFMLTESQPSQLAPSAPIAAPAAPADDKTMLYVGLGAAALLGLVLYTRGKK